MNLSHPTPTDHHPTPTPTPRPTASAEIRGGLLAALPFVAGALPVGVLCGGVARQADLSLLETLALSGLVNAGSAQLIAVGLLSAGVAWPLAVFTVLIVNARYLFYSAALSPHVSALPARWRAVLAFGMTDGVYAVAAKRYRDPTTPPEHAHWYITATAATVYATWLGSTLTGWLHGDALHQLEGLGLEFAVTATYIGLVVSCFTHPRALTAATLAGLLALAFHQLPYQSGLLAATLIALLLATTLHTPKPPPPDPPPNAPQGP